MHECDGASALLVGGTLRVRGRLWTGRYDVDLRQHGRVVVLRARRGHIRERGERANGDASQKADPCHRVP